MTLNPKIRFGEKILCIWKKLIRNEVEKALSRLGLLNAKIFIVKPAVLVVACVEN